jgi:hypothetical protein
VAFGHTDGGERMGLTFTVGNPADAFMEPFAERVRLTLAAHFGDSVVLDSVELAYYSDELGWSGWRTLQERAANALTAQRVPHLLAMEAWCGCYVPADTEPRCFEFDEESTPLDTASLPALVRELEAVGKALGLPTDDAGLAELAERYSDDDLADEDMDIQTYAQLLLAARLAQRRQQVLWVVK